MFYFPMKLLATFYLRKDVLPSYMCTADVCMYAVDQDIKMCFQYML